MIVFFVVFVFLIRIIVFIGFVVILLLGGLEVVNGRLLVGIYSIMVFLI